MYYEGDIIEKKDLICLILSMYFRGYIVNVKVLSLYFKHSFYLFIFIFFFFGNGTRHKIEYDCSFHIETQLQFILKKHD